MQGNDSKHRRAIAPIIATIILVAITVVGGISVLIFAQGFFNNSSNIEAAGHSVIQDAVAYLSEDSEDSQSEDQESEDEEVEENNDGGNPNNDDNNNGNNGNNNGNNGNGNNGNNGNGNDQCVQVGSQCNH